MLREPDWLLTPYRAVVHRPTATGVVADLHLGYAATRQASGEAVPELGEGIVRQRVSRLITTYGLKRLVIAGDMVERGKTSVLAAKRFVAEVRRKGVHVLLVAGNHDRDLPEIPGLELQGGAFAVDGWSVIHQMERNDGRPCIMGHLHPVVRSAAFAGQVPCYLLSEKRLLLPAQSEDAVGGNVLTWRQWLQSECHAIVNDEVLSLGKVVELKERLKAQRR
jgi:uncharacterized protein